MITRRTLLMTTAAAAFAALDSGAAREFRGPSQPFTPGAADPPRQVLPGPWLYFTPAEASAVEAIVDRLIPADDLSVGGKDAGCAVYIDRQLVGSYGQSSRLYMRPPFLHGLPTQGDQDNQTPASRYRLGLAALDAVCRRDHGGKTFAELSDADKDAILSAMEKGDLKLEGAVTSVQLFELLLRNTMEGFFADPIYGGNRNMVSWRMIGFPGARYDFRDHVSKHNQRYPLPPVSIAGRPEWKDAG